MVVSLTEKQSSKTKIKISYEVAATETNITN